MYNDTAIYTTSNLSLGVHNIAAIYGGNSAFACSVSNTIAQAINPTSVSPSAGCWDSFSLAEKGGETSSEISSLSN